MRTPETRYAKSGDVNVAYQVFGEGPITIVYAPGWISHVEVMWEDPRWAAFMARLATFARVIQFDKRGTGCSDRDVGYPTLDDRMDDIRAVMDAAGVERAAIFGSSEGGNMATMFAAAQPDRTTHLILFGCFARRQPAGDYPWAPSLEARARWIESLARDWGKGGDISGIAPSRLGDREFADWFGRLERMASSPGAAVTLARLNSQIDVRDILPTIRVPTLVMHRTRDRDANVEEGRYIASHIPGARFVAIEGDDHIAWTEGTSEIASEIEAFLTGGRDLTHSDTRLSTILCTDIVDSTARQSAVGDAAWRALILQHDAAVRAVLRRYQGEEINTTGDGFLAAFDSPGRGMRAAFAIADAARSLDLPIRAGLHTGECGRRAGIYAGIAITIAVRVAALAGEDEVLVSRTVRDLTVGAGFSFLDRGEYPLKGAPGAWQIFAVQNTVTV
ncbi:MAG TPA: adenylate/guanylate cyclase domain-containing protein [Caulobacterales bacterium]|nr:adenylate/guanylate cyclase domain-containing protein [Caulobacterales bacterium]